MAKPATPRFLYLVQQRVHAANTLWFERRTFADLASAKGELARLKCNNAGYSGGYIYRIIRFKRDRQVAP